LKGGKYTREWQFDKLLGVMHFTDAPWTAIQVSNREKTSGIAYEGVPPALFRLRLAVAVAIFEGEITETEDFLRQQLAELDASSTTQAPVAAPLSATGDDDHHAARPEAKDDAPGNGDVDARPVSPAEAATSAQPVTGTRTASGPAVSEQLPPPPLAQWATDPSGRHQLRYWDGRAWTEYVSDNGQQSRDPWPKPTPGGGS
jgi:hypothetical protein